jgi:hypothetical protein
MTARGKAIAVPAAVAVTVALLAQLPLVRNRLFYLWDDSAAQFIPMYRALGERVLAGHWPVLLDPGAWMGGNLAAEAMFGVWNPVNVANYVLVASLPDLAVAAAVVKTEYLVLLAVGTYLLCREYGAARWAASGLAVAIPFCGFTLYFEAGSWAAGLIAFAWVPWLWWALHRYVTGRMPAIVAFLVGCLTVTAGNPYGLLAVGIVGLGLAVELAVTRRRVWPLLALLSCLGGVALLVFLPLVGNAPVSWRVNRELFNSGQLVPALTDLLNLSMPSHQPKIAGFDTGSMRLETPVVYLAWFVMPLLPWLHWSRLRLGWRELAGPLVVAGCYLVLALGPSNFWWFRWPLRLVEYLYLGLAVVFAVLLSAGLRTDRLARRIGATAAIVLGGAYLSFASWPKVAGQHLVSAVVLAVLIGSLVLVAHRGSRWMVAVLQLGTVAVLVLQLLWFPTNRSMMSYAMPTSVDELTARFGDRYHGNTFQVADHALVDHESRPDLLFGNMYRAAGVESTTAYSGIGNRDFHEALCLGWQGNTCAAVYPRLWTPAAGGPALADLLRLETVVVQRALIDDPPVPPGWHAERTGVLTVLRRGVPPPWPRGRLSAISPTVAADEDDCPNSHTERVRLRRLGPGPATLTFARLNWPGYRAEINGVEVPVRSGPAGLVTVDIPDSVSAGDLWIRWHPPGLMIGIAGTGAGLLGALTLTLLHHRRRRSG